jgi:hypothetical protein
MDKKMEGHSDTQVDIHVDGQTDKHAEKWMYRHRWTCKHINVFKYRELKVQRDG